jgi:hypothetical protein
VGVHVVYDPIIGEGFVFELAVAQQPQIDLTLRNIDPNDDLPFLSLCHGVLRWGFSVLPLL